MRSHRDPQVIALPVTDHRGMGLRGQEAENVRDVLSVIAHRVVVHDNHTVRRSFTGISAEGNAVADADDHDALGSAPS